MALAEADLKKAVELEKEAEKQVFTTNQVFTLTIKSEVLREAVRKVGNSVSKNSPSQALQGIYFQVEDNKITLIGGNSNFYTKTVITDMESFRVQGEGGGLIFPGRKFVDLVNRVTGKHVTIEFNKLQTLIKFKGAKMSLAGLHLDQYPKLPSVNGQLSFSVPSAVLATMYRRTVYATSKSETRPVLTGVNHIVKDGIFRTIGCDSHRLAQQSYQLTGEVEDGNHVIPADSINEVVKHLKDVDMVTIRFDKSYVLYELDDTTIYTRTLHDQYPDTDRIIPPDFSTKIQFRAGELRELLSRATLYANDVGVTTAHILVDAKNGQVRFLSDPTQYGKFQEDIRPLSSEGKDIGTSFNVAYLLDMLGAISPEEQVVLCFTSPKTPFVIRVSGTSSSDLDLVTPIRTTYMKDSVVIEDFNPPEAEVDPFAEDVAAAAEQAQENGSGESEAVEGETNA
ncbi:DNA polymerase III subunit beta [Alicyclobacillus shizuokensis]|uniref:DNA polymerase III subunit beta n=1 Tax=Alicyclobacillus shizuokensis TaxID=392014 RepID=UPI0008367D91|nr:DNA polymerase III subunit beta [Alicyclobacillus shizuokensis]